MMKESVNEIWRLLNYIQSALRAKPLKRSIIVVRDSEDFEDFLSKCAAHGILVEYNPDHKIDLKFMLAEQEENNPRAKMTRSKTLGWYYETEQLKRRIAQYKGAMTYTPGTKVRVTFPKAPESDKNKFVRDDEHFIQVRRDR